MGESKVVNIDIGRHVGEPEVGGDGDNHSYGEDSDGDEVTLTVDDNPEELFVYKKLTHKPKEKDAKIGEAKFKGESISGFGRLDTYDDVSVFYWDGDEGYEHPLLIQLGNDESKCYAPEEDNYENWEDVGSSVTDDGMEAFLDEKNCEHNEAHAVDILKTGKQMYECSVCREPQIYSTDSDENGYKKVVHTVNNGYVGKFMEDTKNVTGIDITKKVHSAEVYWYLPQGDKKALLIHYSGSWYRRDKGDPPKWTSETTLLSSHEPRTILQHLKKLHRVTSRSEDLDEEEEEAEDEDEEEGAASGEEEQRALQTQGTVTVDISYHYRKDSQVKNIGSTYSYISKTGGNVTIQEDKPTETPGYKKITHTSQGATIGAINKDDSNLDSFTPALEGVYQVSVYYWIGDSYHEHPLIVQLGNDEKYYISRPNTNRWYDAGISRGNLTLLDMQNCSKNTVHIVDISRTSQRYMCQAGGCGVQVNIEPKDEPIKYKKVTHTLASGSIGRLKSSSGNITGIELTSGLTRLEVYHYPKEHINPLLIYLSSLSIWIERTSKTGNDWSPLDDGALSGNTDTEKIFERLKTLYEKTKETSEQRGLGGEGEEEEETIEEKVTIDIGYHPGDGYVENDYGNEDIFYYPEHVGGKDISITLVKDIKIPGFVKCAHKPKSKKIKDIQYDGEDQEELPNPSNYNAISVYYMDKDYNNPLVLQFDNENKYYVKKDDEDENTWEESTVRFTGTLQQIIYQVRCKKIGAHAIDILKNKKGSYKCTICNQQDAISADSTDEIEGFKKVVHTISGGYIGKIREDSEDITTIAITNKVYTADVYWYPTNSEKPCLIYLHYTTSIQIWYQAVPDSPEKWKVPDEPPKDTNKSTIHAFLRRILPSVKLEESLGAVQNNERGGATEGDNQVGQRKGKIVIDIENVPNSSETQKDNVKDNTFYYDNEQVTIEEDKTPDGFTEYIILTHKPTSPEAKIESIIYSKTAQDGFPQDLYKVQSVAVYYWTRSEYTNPLVAHLGGINKYYTYEDNDTWSDVSDYVKTENLNKFLEIKNCTKTTRHVVNISDKGMGSSKSYKCPSCKKQNFTVSPVEPQGYKYFGHTLSGSGSISGFKDDKSYQTGFQSFHGYDQANVYWYPDKGRDKPLLICIKSGTGQEGLSSKPLIWYKRFPSNGNRWVLENEGPPTEEGPEVLDLLKRIHGVRGSTVHNSGHADGARGENPSASGTDSLSYLWKVGGPLSGGGLAGFGGWYAWKTLRRST